MPRASRLPVSPKLAKELQENLLRLLISLRTVNITQAFYKDFFTKEEQLMVAKRLMLFMMLAKGYELKDIVIILGVSREMVRIHEQSWRAKGEDFQKLIQHLIKDEQGRKLWESISRTLKPLDLALDAKRDMKARAKLLQGDID